MSVMKWFLTILAFLFSFNFFSQEIKAEKKFHFGAIAQLMGVTYDNVALNATLFGEIKNHQLGIGSHYDFFNRPKSQFGPNTSETNLNSGNLDIYYRFYAINKGDRFRTFVQLTGKFDFLKEESNFVTIPNSDQQLAYGPIFSSSYSARGNYSESNIGVFLGIGEEFKIMKGLFANAHLAFGIKTYKSRYNIQNLETNLTTFDHNQNYLDIKSFALLGSIGVGYRF